MKRKDLLPIVIASVVAGVLALVLSSIFFNPPKKDSTVPSVTSLSQTLPDIKGDSDYNSFLNEKALDPTQPVTISPGENPVPFNSSQ